MRLLLSTVSACVLVACCFLPDILVAADDDLFVSPPILSVEDNNERKDESTTTSTIEELSIDEEETSDESRNLFAKKNKKGHKHKGQFIQGQNIPLPPIAPVAVAVAAPVVHQQISCPAGSTLVDNRCLVTEVFPAQVSCPSGYTMLGGQCGEYAHAQRICPQGSRLSGSRCIISEIVQADLVCPEGELDSTGGTCQAVGLPGMTCPHGFVMTAEQQCRQAVEASASCPDGFMMMHGMKDKHMLLHKGGQTCVRKDFSEAAPVCPNGTQMDFDGKKCFSMRMMKPRCPKGFWISFDKASCFRKVKKSLTPCPPGFQVGSSHKAAMCERILETPPQFTCSPGSVLNPLSGQCEKEVPASYRCPPGYHPSRDQQQMCEQVVPKEGFCQPGTTAIGYGASTHCQIAVDHDLIECCPPGFEIVFGRCEKHQMFPPSTGCLEECEVVRTVKPDLYCPEHYGLMGMHCARQLSHPCEQQAAASVPPECEMYVNGGSLRANVPGVENIPPPCATFLLVVGVTTCPNDRIPSQTVCPNNAVLEGDLCVIREAIITEPYCRVGVLNPATGQCEKVTRVPIKTECPGGTTRIGSRCLSYENHPAEFACPGSSVMDQNGDCIIRVPSLFSAPEVVKTAAIPVCASGTIQGSMCYDAERIPRSHICPGNSVPTSKHQNLASMNMQASEFGLFCIEVADFIVVPPSKKFSKPRYYCPDGRLAKGKHCHSHESVPAILTCPPDTTSAGNLCVRILPPVLTTGHMRTSIPTRYCPPGTAVQGNQCVLTRELQVEACCPPGFELQANSLGIPDRECLRLTQPVMSCPAGTQQTASGCLHSKAVAPILTAAPCLIDCII